MSAPVAARILIVDDEASLMTALCQTLELEGYTTVGFTSAQRALNELSEREVDILLTDLMMPEMDGISLLRAAQQIDRDLVGIVMTGHGTIDTAVKALQSGALDYVLKPFRLDNLLPVLNRAMATRRLQVENIRLRETVAIYELTRAIARGLDHDEIIQRTLQAASQQDDVGGACMLVPTEDRRNLRVAAGSDTGRSDSSESLLPLDAAVLHWISSTREQLATWEGSTPLAAVFEHPFSLRYPGAALPIVAGGNLHGVLTFNLPSSQRRLSPGQVKALDVLTNTAASAFESASLLSQLRAANEDLERRVAERTRDLEASNADLESFSYSVSHDLRAPLRAIDGFCSILVSDYGREIPAEALDFLTKVCAGVARMQRLIDDLLHLARFTRQPLERRTVRMTELARRVAAGLEPQWPGREVRLEVAQMPDCDGDGSLLEQVWTNLLANALKFTATRTVARIQVSAFRRADDYVYFVRDNGVGFDMQHADKLFGVFQRMHSQAQFPGTGIGLSIVHRIIRRHGGEAWAESRLDEGTTLYFSLPAAGELRGQ